MTVKNEINDTIKVLKEISFTQEQINDEYLDIKNQII